MKKSINKFPFWMALLLVTFYSCQQEDYNLSELQGTVHFGGISLEFAPMGSPGSRISGNSSWVHIFPNSADLVFTNKVTDQQYILEYNPNDFSAPYAITLPYGAYEYHSIVEGGVFSAFLPFEARGEFSLESQNLEISLEAATGYGLVTVKNQYVEKAFISEGDDETNLVEHPDGKYWFIYVKEGTGSTLNIRESFQGTTISRELEIAANRHYNFVLKLNEDGAAITALILAQFELEEEEILLGSNSNFFVENGTIKCPEAIPGEKGMVNDKIYEAVDRALLIQRRKEGADLSCVCTSLVTDMSEMFKEAFNFNQPIGNLDVSKVTNMSNMFERAHNFNQPIGNWDVSNVTRMYVMFRRAFKFNQSLGNWDVSNVTNMVGMFEKAQDFNQPIVNWDVSKVTDMSAMFQYAESFNRPIGNWDVSKVTNMVGVFDYACKFNQPIGNWDVSKVTIMNGMFKEAINFNQPIGNWDVSNVTYMTKMFEGAEKFNQPIGNWDVRNVTTMWGMFLGASVFNQPIRNWDVGNVSDMKGMFNNATLFNQNLSEWCVQNITSEPTNFSTESALLNANKPVWGTCQD